MLNTPPSIEVDKTSPSVDEQAAEWWLKHQRGLVLSESKAFETWLVQDKSHAIAFNQIALTDAALNDIPTHEKRRRIESVKSPRAKKSPLIQAISNRMSVLSPKPFITTFAIVFIAAFAVHIYLRQPLSVQNLVVAKGEQATKKLADGTQITLDTNTEVLVKLYRDRRELNLTHGQLLLFVHRDVKRPFHVLAGSSKVTVLGTKFLVRYLDDTVTVAVQEGHVRVNGAAKEKAITSSFTDLLAEQSVKVDADGNLQALRHIDLSDIAPWRDGRIIFKNATLQDAIAEFARYSDRKIVLEDAATANLRVTGSFEYKKLDSFLHALPNVLPVKVYTQGNQTIIRSKNM